MEKKPLLHLFKVEYKVHDMASNDFPLYVLAEDFNKAEEQAKAALGWIKEVGEETPAITVLSIENLASQNTSEISPLLLMPWSVEADFGGVDAIVKRLKALEKHTQGEEEPELAAGIRLAIEAIEDMVN